MLLILIFLIKSSYSQCHPQCSYQCDNPVCYAVCQPYCLPFNCMRCEMVSINSTICHDRIRRGCDIHCPSDQCETDSCPQCEILCSSSLCENYPNCQVECEAPQCGWSCQKPTNCPQPTCILQCEQPACATNDGNRTYNNLNYYVTGILFVIILCMISSL